MILNIHFGNQYEGPLTCHHIVCYVTNLKTSRDKDSGRQADSFSFGTAKHRRIALIN